MSTILDDILKDLEICKVKELYPHEQTISSNLKRLKETMLNIGHLVDPIIVDKKSKVVLDGHHRLKVLQVIECPHASCQTVDYQSKDIKVGTWIPVTKSPLGDVLKDVKKETVDFDSGMAAVKGLKSPFMLARKEGATITSQILSPGSYKIKEMIEEQVFVLSTLKNLEVEYVADDLLHEYLDRGYSVLYRRPYTKEEIIKTAHDHEQFPPKSTRHLIPGRLIRLNMKLGWLHEDKADAYEQMRIMLQRRAVEGSVRRYNEGVIVIY